MLATIADLENYTGARLENRGDLQAYIDSASVVVANYLGYDPEYKMQTVLVRGRGTGELRLSHKPVIRVYWVADYETGEPLYENRGGRADYVVSEEFVLFKDLRFPERLLEVGYTSGWQFAPAARRVISGGRSGTAAYETIIDCGGAADEYSSHVIAGGSSFNDEPAAPGAAAAPALLKQTALRIAALLFSESDNNIGVTSKSFGDSGSRNFLNYTNFDKYLAPLSRHRLVTI
jgi:hypothetical protein